MEVEHEHNTPQRPQRLGILRRTLTSKSLLVSKRTRSSSAPNFPPRPPPRQNPEASEEEEPLEVYPRRNRPLDVEDEEEPVLPAPPAPAIVESMDEFYLREFREGTATYEMLEDYMGPLAAQNLVFGGMILRFHELYNLLRILATCPYPVPDRTRWF